MEAAEQSARQVMEENETLKRLIELFDRQDMDRQSQDFAGIFWHVVDMQMQLTTMMGELQGIRKQLSQMQEDRPKSVTEKLMDKVAHLQEKIASLSGCLSLVGNSLVETAQQAVSAFREKGRAEMCRVPQTGISGVRSILSDYRECLANVMTDYEKTTNQIDSVGDEPKQIGNGVSNVGRLLTGKGTKKVPDEKSGAGTARVVNKSVEEAVGNLRKEIDGIDEAFEKLDRLSSSLDAGKKIEEGGRMFIKGKLSQMREKAGQKKAPEQDKTKTKSKEECL